MANKIQKNNGFTLIELLIVIGIISILSSAIIIAINPSRQFKLARDTKRTTDVEARLNSIGQNMAENQGRFTCGGQMTNIPASTTIMKSGGGGFDIAPCIIPTFIPSMPFDPNKAGARYVSVADYDTQYSIFKDAGDRITIQADSEIVPTKPISAIR